MKIHLLLLSFSDIDTGNPLVAGFQDDLDPDDVAPPSPILPQRELPIKSHRIESTKHEVFVETLTGRLCWFKKCILRFELKT